MKWTSTEVPDVYKRQTTTNVSHKGHLIVHTSDIYGEWSKPVWIDQGGIDPTLLFDGEDVYFASTSRDEDDRDGIFMCKINPYTGEKLSESVCISHGCGGKMCIRDRKYTAQNRSYRNCRR